MRGKTLKAAQGEGNPALRRNDMNSLAAVAEMALISLLSFGFALFVGLASLAGIFRLAFGRLRAGGR